MLRKLSGIFSGILFARSLEYTIDYHTDVSYEGLRVKVTKETLRVKVSKKMFSLKVSAA